MITTTSLTPSIAAMTKEERAKLIALTVPRIVQPYMAHVPHPKQLLFLGLNNKETLFGGSAGSGKSDSLLLAALQYVDVPGYSALILRRTWPDLNSAGAILDRARVWLANTPARSHDGGRYWTFPSGARLSFGYISHENDKYKVQSSEYQFIGVDELTQWPETQYEYLFSRVRRPQIPCLNCSTPTRLYGYAWRHTAKPQRRCPHVFPDPKMLDQYGESPMDGTRIWDVPLRVRSCTNPGGVGHEWVYNRFVNPVTRHDGTIFVPALLKDNPSLDQKSYEESLSHLGPLERERLLNGDWNVFEQGEIFQRDWFADVADMVPNDKNVRRVRAWDMAATEGAGDYTVGALIATLNGEFWIEDIVRGQWAGAKLEQIVAQTAAVDGRYVPIIMEQEPGSAGKSLVAYYRRQVVPGYNFNTERPTGSKVTRATPWAISAANRSVRLVRGEWNRAFLNEAELFPLGANDDQIDGVSLGFGYLNFSKRSRLIA